MYRRRRLVVGLLALVLLGGVWFGVSAISGALAGPPADPDPAAAATSSPGAEPTPTVTAATKGYVPVACLPEALDVRDHVAATAVALGSAVAFDLELVNAGTVPCLLEGGSAALGVVVYSGPDRVWSSSDCPQEPTERALLLDVGVGAELVATWDQVRSAPGCPDGQTAVQPGSYRALISLGDGTAGALEWEREFRIE